MYPWVWNGEVFSGDISSSVTEQSGEKGLCIAYPFKSGTSTHVFCIARLAPYSVLDTLASDRPVWFRPDSYPHQPPIRWTLRDCDCNSGLWNSGSQFLHQPRWMVRGTFLVSLVSYNFVEFFFLRFPDLCLRRWFLHLFPTWIIILFSLKEKEKVKKVINIWFNSIIINIGCLSV